MTEAQPTLSLPDIPALRELKGRRQWVAWRYANRNGRTTKPPVNPHTGEGASHSDPTTWGSYDEAVACARTRGLAGVGFVITDDDDFTGADLDSVRNDDFGVLEPWAQEIINLGETYAEVSPSGKGLRLIWRGKISATIKCDPRHVEIYRSLRYLTITGDHVPGTPSDIRPAPRTQQALIDRVSEFRVEQEKARESVPPLQHQAPRPGVLHSTSSFGGSFFRNVNDIAIRDLSSWVPMLFGHRAKYQPATQAFRISSQDLGRDLEEDLSIAPNGIVDFGVADMGDPKAGKRTPIDIVLEFGSHRSAKDAALWICDRISKDPHDLGWGQQEAGSRFFRGAPDNPIPDPLPEPAAVKPPAGIRTFDFAALVLENVPEEPDYIEPNLLGHGGFLLIGGPPKAQKSFLEQDILVSAATGIPFLGGSFTVPRPLRCFWLQAEMNEKLLRRRAKAMTGLTDEQLNDLASNLIVSDRFRMILDENGARYAADLIKSKFPDEPPDILAFDPMANLFDQENENDNAQVMKFLTLRIEMVRQIVNPMAGVILVHHATKKGPDEIRKDPFNCFRGGGALRGHYDAGIIIFRKDDEAEEREIHFELRGGESPEPITVKLEAGRMVKTASRFFGEQRPGWPDAAMQKLILGNIDAAWNRGDPWSNSPNTEREGRFAPAIIHRDFPSVQRKAADALINAWLMPGGVLRIAIRNTNTKLKGLQVVPQ